METGFSKYFSELPSEPRVSLRGGNALDDYAEMPEYDAEVDKLSLEYFETYFWGLAHLDVMSWRYYLPFLLEHAVQNTSNSDSNMVEAFLSSLRPPDREPPRFGSLTSKERDAVVFVLDKLAFSDDSGWKGQAMLALEEFWAPGALYE